MAMLWTAFLFLLFGQNLADKEDDKFIGELYHIKDLYFHPPIDFRCSMVAYSRFNISIDYIRMIYFFEPKERKGCKYQSDDRKIRYYPPLTALDPMMAFYIHKIHEGIALVPVVSAEFPREISYTPKRRNKYCLDIRTIGSNFVDYFELFSSDDETCWKMEEIVKECTPFRQMWFHWVRDLSERFCMGEDGCYKTMEFYEDDMPHCVKYIANRQFQSPTFGSWHHSIINYCQLTDMIPDAKDANYDRSILFEDDKTGDDLMAMCQFLRFRLLPEEGKEEEIREIKLEDRDNRGTDTDRSSAALYLERTISVTILLFRLLPEEGKEEEIREITLERREEHRATDNKKDNVAFFPDRAVPGAIILLVISVNTLL